MKGLVAEAARATETVTAVTKAAAAAAAAAAGAREGSWAPALFLPWQPVPERQPQQHAVAGLGNSVFSLCTQP